MEIKRMNIEKVVGLMTHYKGFRKDLYQERLSEAHNLKEGKCCSGSLAVDEFYLKFGIDSKGVIFSIYILGKSLYDHLMINSRIWKSVAERIAEKYEVKLGFNGGGCIYQMKGMYLTTEQDLKEEINKVVSAQKKLDNLIEVEINRICSQGI